MDAVARNEDLTALVNALTKQFGKGITKCTIELDATSIPCIRIEKKHYTNDGEIIKETAAYIASGDWRRQPEKGSMVNKEVGDR